VATASSSGLATAWKAVGKIGGFLSGVGRSALMTRRGLDPRTEPAAHKHLDMPQGTSGALQTGRDRTEAEGLPKGKAPGGSSRSVALRRSRRVERSVGTETAARAVMRRPVQSAGESPPPAVERPAPDVSRIIPGDWGKAGPGWLALPLLSAERKFGAGGRIHQFLWRCSRIVSTREKGTVRPGAMRSRSKPSQVVRAGFAPGRIAVTQRVSGCYCASARPGGSGGL
jgi:hypothetical protein